jgi:hypothetical protein
MAELTPLSAQLATCGACWQHINAAVTAVYGLTATLRVQDIERLTALYPQLSISEHRLLQSCQDGTGCAQTEQASQAWIKAWHIALQGEEV